MAFWEKAEKVMNFVNDGLQRMQESNQRQMEQRQEAIDRSQQKASRIENDRELVEKFKSSSGVERVGYGKELESRGYLERNSEGKMQRTNKKL
ncbi:hypothetical protein [Paenibacillus sp. NPDC058177]|uniref:hypothetical protein n=1 Tax=Paenibacillus sp. NPDC058177 TaxID=3346369 RepID=UPI0036DB6D8B